MDGGAGGSQAPVESGLVSSAVEMGASSGHQTVRWTSYDRHSFLLGEMMSDVFNN